jgi:hypothetical protein
MSKISSEDHDLALAVLERDQLATAKSHRYPRRNLKGGELLVLWALRVYVVFMLAVVLYQVVGGNH